MILQETIQQAVQILAEGAKPCRIILFGSYAAGTAREDSDLDLLVVEPGFTGRRKEMVRLRALLRPLAIPVDVMVTDETQFDLWKDVPGTAIYEAARLGRVMYERAG